MGDFVTAADWVGAVLVAGALAMIAFTHREHKAARLMIVLGTILTIGRWVMWSFMTDAPWPWRAAIGAIFGALILGALPALWRWSVTKEPTHAEHKATISADEITQLKAQIEALTPRHLTPELKSKFLSQIVVVPGTTYTIGIGCELCVDCADYTQEIGNALRSVPGLNVLGLGAPRNMWSDGVGIQINIPDWQKPSPVTWKSTAAISAAT